jgi:Gram-negative bacterial TonB protein C-terminal
MQNCFCGFMRVTRVHQRLKSRMSKTATLLFFTILFSDSAKAQEWQRISPESASTHLLKKVDPVYPAFAKAAGLEGVVCIEVGIYPDGRIHSVSVESGPPALIKAAEDAVLHYIYRPFEKDGEYVVVQTNLDVIFKLPKPRDVEHYYPPPLLTELSSPFLKPDEPAPHLSVSLQKWIDEDLQRKRFFFSCDASTSNSENIIVQIPVKDLTAQLFLVLHRDSCMCGATGNCPFELVEVNGKGVHCVIDSMGSEVVLRQRKNAQYPEIFSLSHMSAAYASIAGFIKIGEEWGQLYCGTYFADGIESEIHVCR